MANFVRIDFGAGANTATGDTIFGAFTKVNTAFTDFEQIISTITPPDLSNYYTKPQVDALIANVTVDLSDYYTIAQTNAALNLKADKLTTYTRVETNNLLNGKADKNTTYSKVEVDNALSLKANRTSTYNKTEVDNALNLKADKVNTYTKTQVNALVNNISVDLSNYYTKPETYSRVQVYNKAEIDAIVDGIESGGADLTNYYTKNEMNSKLDVIDTRLADTYTIAQVNALLDDVEVDLSNYYTKAEVYNKAEVDHEIAMTTALFDNYYTQLQVNNLLDGKLNIGYFNDFVDETDGKFVAVNNSLALKADKLTTYTRVEVDAKDALKLNITDFNTFTATNTVLLNDRYTKSETNTLLNTKANVATTYTKTEVNDALALKVNLVEYNQYKIDNAALINSINLELDNTYTKTEVDTIINNLSSDTVIQITANATAVPAWQNKMIIVNSNTSVTITLPQNIANTNFVVRNIGVGVVTITNNVTVNMHPSSTGLNITFGNMSSVVVYNNLAVVTGEDDALIDVEQDILELQGQVATINTRLADTYTKSEVDAKDAVKLNSAEFELFKTSNTAAINAKANQSTTYSKTEVNNLIDGVEVDLSNYYTKTETYSRTETNNLLTAKANQSTTYTITQVDNLLTAKANVATTYTMTQVDNALNLKADKSTSYTRTEIDGKDALKLNISDFNTFTASNTTALGLKADKSTTYTKTEVDALVAGGGGDLSNYYTKPQTDTLLNAKVSQEYFNMFESETEADIIALETLVPTKADIATTYNKTEVNNSLALKADKLTTYTKTEVDALISGSGGDLSNYYTKPQTDTLLNAKANQSTTYSKVEVNNALATKISESQAIDIVTDALVDYYTIPQTNSRLDGKTDVAVFTSFANNTSVELNAKANVSTTYTKVEVDALIAGVTPGVTIINKTGSNGIYREGRSAGVYGTSGTNSADFSWTTTGTNRGATGTSSFAVNTGTTASGEASFAFGATTTASGQGSVAGGFQSQAVAQYSVAIGYNVAARGSYSTAFGIGTEASEYASFVLGRNNVIRTPQSAWVDGAIIFAIGNGALPSSRQDAFTITNGGSVNTRGLITYNSDLSGFYTTRSLVDKGYVDNQVATRANVNNVYSKTETDTLLSTKSTILATSGNTIQFWTGTQTQYDAIGTKNPNTLYFIEN